MEYNNIYTFKFISIITIIASALLALTSQSLKIKQEINIEIDRQKNILECLGFDVNNYTEQDIKNEYKNKITFYAIDHNGKKNESIVESNLKSEENKATGMLTYYYKKNEYFPIYYSNNPKAYIVPISGKGLWSTLYGYIALEEDFNTVKGITFYKHKETAGLGGEIEKTWFRNNFIGKRIFDNNGNLISIKVIKGRVIDVLTENDWAYAVDGISGATVTSNGVTKLLKRDLMRYNNFFKNH